MVGECRISLQNNDSACCYTNGSEIRGTVKLHLHKSQRVKSISIELQCTEHNHWEQTRRAGKKTHHICYESDNSIIRNEVVIYASTCDEDKLSGGNHHFDFIFKLPYDIPSSYEGPYGCVSYRLKAVVQRSTSKSNYEHSLYFNVLSLINLAKLSPNHFELTSLTNEKTIGCWCSSRGRVSIEMTLPKLAFVLGETIPIGVRLTNGSSSVIKRLEVELIKYIRHKVETPHCQERTTTETMLKLKEVGVGSREQHTYKLDITIPKHLETPNYTNCRLFDVTYKLIITAQMGTFSRNLELLCLPQLGHVNIVGDVYQSFIPGFYVPAQPPQLQYQAAGLAPASAPPEAPPPYEEIMK